MLYEFKCNEHGLFEVEQSINEEHKANCPECGKPAQRIFSRHQWIFAGSIFRKDGSLREDKDYAPVMGG